MYDLKLKKSALVKMDDAEIVEYLEDEFVMCEIFEVWEHIDTSLLGNVLFILSNPYQFIFSFPCEKKPLPMMMMNPH